MPQPFRVEAYDFPRGRLVVPYGELDAATCDELADHLKAAPGQGVVVDLSHLTFIDSSGLGVLVVARTRAVREGGTLVLARPGPMVSRVLEITGLDIWEAEWDPAWEEHV